MTDKQPTVIFCTATQSIIDYVYTGRGETNTEAIKRLWPDYGSALTAIPIREAQALYEARFKTPVEEISEADFLYALNVLPPVDWTHARGAESFKISERLAGCVTTVLIAMQGRYFRFHDDIRLPHETCCERVQAFIAKLPASAIKPEVSK